MLTIQALQDLGVNTKEGLTRCMNNESFYLRMVKKGLADENYEKLKAAVEAGDIAQIHEISHALKGTTGNLSLTPLYEPIAFISDQSKAGTQMDYMPYVDEMMKTLPALRALCAD